MSKQRFSFKAEYDHSSIVVYQAFNDDIAKSTVHNQKLGYGGFKFNRRTWIKPSYYWMMHRSYWATKENQNRILKITLPREFFDELIELGIPSQPLKKIYEPYGLWDSSYDNENLRSNLARKSDIIYQLDPERNDKGFRTGTRAIQIGLKGETLMRYSLSQIIRIEDITPLVKEEFACLTRDYSSYNGGSGERAYPEILKNV